MDERLIAMLKGAKGAMTREIQSEGITTHTPTTNTSGEKALPVYNGVDGSQLLESIPAGAQLNGQHVAQPMGQGGPNEYASRPVANTNPIQQTHQGVAANKLPPEILKAMVENPIQQVAPKINAAGMRTFDLNDLPADMLKGAPVNNIPTQAPAPVYVNETIQTPQVNQYGQKTVTITEAELDAKIKNALFEFMATTFTKTLTEATIKKTISTLIKEGKLKVTQKKKV